jgi:IS30 family transposase
LARRVERLLARKWSPAQISAQLCRDHPDDPRWWVSTEAIYQWIYVEGHGPLRTELSRHLKLGRPARHHGNWRGQLPDRVHISQRPLEAIGRAVPGHWEGDLILGAGGRSQVGMITERQSRYTMLFALPDDRTAATVRDALTKIVRTLPTHLRRSLTWDNGKEMAEHVAFSIDTDLDVYFADPGRPWQRGTAEHTIGMLRAYLPKGEDLAHHTTRTLNTIAIELNRRPRKLHNWRTPAELYADLLVQ